MTLADYSPEYSFRCLASAAVHDSSAALPANLRTGDPEVISLLAWHEARVHRFFCCRRSQTIQSGVQLGSKTSFSPRAQGRNPLCHIMDCYVQNEHSAGAAHIRA